MNRKKSNIKNCIRNLLEKISLVSKWKLDESKLFSVYGLYQRPNGNGTSCYSPQAQKDLLLNSFTIFLNMSRAYDNWERLVAAVVNRERLRQIALSDSFDSSVSDDSISRLSFASSHQETWEISKNLGLVYMENLLGLLRINVLRGINLAKRYALSSDPYVIVRMDKQKLKTRVVRKNVNPEWNEELTLSIADPNLPIKLQVYDKNTFSLDDKMGDAEFEIHLFLEALKMKMKMHLENVLSGTIITKIKPNRENCLSEESSIVWENGEVIQHMFLRLRNVECGEIELKLNWSKVPGSRGL